MKSCSHSPGQAVILFCVGTTSLVNTPTINVVVKFQRNVGFAPGGQGVAEQALLLSIVKF